MDYNGDNHAINKQVARDQQIKLRFYVGLMLGQRLRRWPNIKPT